MNYRGYQIEETQPGKFYVYEDRDNWLTNTEPLDIRPTLKDAQRFVDIRRKYSKEPQGSQESQIISSENKPDVVNPFSASDSISLHIYNNLMRFFRDTNLIIVENFHLIQEIEQGDGENLIRYFTYNGALKNLYSGVLARAELWIHIDGKERPVLHACNITLEKDLPNQQVYNGTFEFMSDNINNNDIYQNNVEIVRNVWGKI